MRVFFLVLPLMSAGAISAILVRQRPTWKLGRRVVLVAAVGGSVALAAYFAAVGLQVIPGRPELLAYAFLITQLASLPSLAEVGGTPLRGRGILSHD